MVVRHATLPFFYTPAITIVILVAFIGCAGSEMVDDMKQHNPISVCPDSPNCVSSESQDERHAVKPMYLAGKSNTEWAEIKARVGRLPRAKIVTNSEWYVHATLKSRLFGFVDDLELKLDPHTQMIRIRSAARSGYYDLGVNRRRVENLRKQLKSAKLIR